MAGLSTATAAFCDGGGKDRAALDAAFKQAVLGWAASSICAWGRCWPTNRFERFAFWPDPKGLGRRQIAAELSEKDQDVLARRRCGRRALRCKG